jgi:hypothetical protein
LKKKKRFKIADIKSYLEGGILLGEDGERLGRENTALNIAITLLEDKEDGIAEVTKREKKRKK